jgi:taurine dioxygenase
MTIADRKTFHVTPLTPHVGGEISGIDLTQPLDAAQVRQLTDALVAHGVIFFREQEIDMAALKRLGRYFGELHIHSGMPGHPDHPEVRPLHADENSKHVAGEEWHTDLSCDPVPPLASILYLHTLPPIGGDTCFASMYAAYDALSDGMKAYLENLTATHDGRIAFGRFDPNKKYNMSVHPVIPRHPVTGRKLIYVNRGFTSHINELPALESAKLLDFLYTHIESPLWQCRFRWRKHSIAFWDNRCTQHYAVWDYRPQVRSGWRVQIANTQPPLA